VEAVFLSSAFYRKLANHKNGILALPLLDGAWKAMLDEWLEEAVRRVPLVFLALFHFLSRREAFMRVVKTIPRWPGGWAGFVMP